VKANLKAKLARGFGELKTAILCRSAGTPGDMTPRRPQSRHSFESLEQVAQTSVGLGREELLAMSSSRFVGSAPQTSNVQYGCRAISIERIAQQRHSPHRRLRHHWSGHSQPVQP
jgi:hypothetical protein